MLRSFPLYKENPIDLCVCISFSVLDVDLCRHAAVTADVRHGRTPPSLNQSQSRDQEVASAFRCVLSRVKYFHSLLFPVHQNTCILLAGL